MSLSMLDKKEQNKLAERLVKRTHFNKNEIETLLSLYKEGNKKKQKMDRQTFIDFLGWHFGMTENIMMDNIFRVFDQDNDAFVSMEEWVKGMSILLRGNLEERTKFCFEVYDLNGDGVITREEMNQLLKDCLKSLSKSQDEDPEDTKRELVEITLKLLTHQTNQIGFSEFCKNVDGEHLLQEILGQCLPNEVSVRTFEQGFFFNNCHCQTSQKR